MPCCGPGGDALAYVVARQLQLQPELMFIFDEESATSTSAELGVEFLPVASLAHSLHAIFALVSSQSASRGCHNAARYHHLETCSMMLL